MVILICISGLFIYLILKSIFGSDNNTPPPYVAPKLNPQQLAESEAILRKKYSVAEVIEQAKLKERVFLWHRVEHLTEEELIEISKALTKTELKRWFNYHHKNYYHFPAKAYAFIQAKINDQVWFTDEEFAEREAAGKRSTFMTKDDLLIEQFTDIFYDNALGYKKKIAAVDELLIKQSKKDRLAFKLLFFDIAYDKVKLQPLTDEDIKKLKSIKSMQTRAYNKLELKEEDIAFRILDEYLRIIY